MRSPKQFVLRKEKIMSKELIKELKIIWKTALHAERHGKKQVAEKLRQVYWQQYRANRKTYGRVA